MRGDPIDAPFTTIEQHWAHYLERDIPVDAPDVQVSGMKNAFAAGAISGLQLGLTAVADATKEDARASIMAHVQAIKALGETT